MAQLIEDLPPTDESLAVQTLDPKSLKPPESRVGPAWAVRNRIHEFVRLDKTRAERRDKIQRWIDGARPFSTKKLQDTGQGNRTNFNPREAEAMVDAAKSPYYSLIFRNTQFMSLKSTYGMNPAMRSQWAKSIARSFHQMLDEWDEFSSQMELTQSQMLLYGVGYAMFDDEENWQWQSRKMNEFLVPDGIPASVKKLPEAVYFRKISPVDLFKLIDKEVAKGMGWHPDRVKRAIIKVAPQALMGSGGGPASTLFGAAWNEEYTASLRRGDVMWNAQSAQIKLAGHLIKEFNGKITHSIFIDDPMPTSPNDIGDEELMLFKKIGQFRSFEEIIQPFFHDVGVGEWHSVRALGPKIRDTTIASARMFCTMIDGGMKGSVFLLQAADAQAEEISQMIEIAGANIIPSSLSLQQNRIADSLEGPMNVRRELQNTIQTTTAQYVPRVSGENSEPTLGQAQLNYRNQQSLSESDSDHYLKRLDCTYYEMLRRVLKMGVKLYKRLHPEDEPPDYEDMPSFPNDAQEGAYYMIRRCAEEGVPLEALDIKWICGVKATRGAGGGSPAMEDISTREMISLLPTMNERGRQNALRDRASYLRGASNVDNYYDPPDMLPLPTKDDWDAIQENNDMTDPMAELEILPEQNHVAHFGKHGERAVQMIQALQSGQMDPVQVLMFLHTDGPHMKGHLDQLAGDESRKDQVQQMEAQWLALSKFTDQLQQQVEESMQAQQQPQPQVDPEIVKVMGDLKIKETKTQGDLAIKAKAQEAKNRLKDLQSAFDMNLAKREAEQKAAMPQPFKVA